MILAAFVFILLLACVVAFMHYRKIAVKWMDETREALYQNRKYTRKEMEQIQALFSIYSLFQINHPLPTLGTWAIQPDFAKHLISEILISKPDLILETGSGVSTLIAAYALRKNGKGKIISLEHDGAYRLKSQRELELHGLSDIAQIIEAPLQEYSLEGKTWRWYSLDKIGNPRFDLMIVDGPPQATGPLARFPALPLCDKYFAKKVTLMIDDAGRPDEKEILKRWAAQFPDFKAETADTHAGLVFLRRG